MDGGALAQLDRLAGLGIEAAIRVHHRRRLRRVGRIQQLNPPDDGELWAAGSPPPRAGCELAVLIDGADALPQIEAAIAAAQHEVWIAGWHIAPEFGLSRKGAARRLRDVLGDAAERARVRLLLWAGAPLPVFSPSRSETRRAREELVRGTRVECLLDAHERPMHCHHEKLVVVDGKLAFVGGIDLTSLGGDRHDTRDHPARASIGWHDAAARLRGPVVGDVAAHFSARWSEVADAPLAPPPPPSRCGRSDAQLVRTIPERIYRFSPRGEFRVLESYVRALRSARSLIYLENQFLWAPQIVEILRQKLRDPPEDAFRLVVLLPAKPNNGADDTRGQLGLLVEADGGNGRFLAATIRSRTGELSGPLYVHAKIGIVDDRWLTIGSANLNEHSLFNDSEVNVVTCSRELARATRLRLWSEHLERPIDSIDGDPTTVIDELWKPLAREQLERRRRGDAATHRLLELPGVSRRSAAILGPLQSLIVDG